MRKLLTCACVCMCLCGCATKTPSEEHYNQPSYTNQYEQEQNDLAWSLFFSKVGVALSSILHDQGHTLIQILD